MGRLFSPYILVVPLLLLMDYFWILQGQWREDLLKIILKGGCLFVFMSPFLWTLKGKIKIFRDSDYAEKPFGP